MPKILQWTKSLCNAGLRQIKIPHGIAFRLTRSTISNCICFYVNIYIPIQVHQLILFYKNTMYINMKHKDETNKSRCIKNLRIPKKQTQIVKLWHIKRLYPTEQKNPTYVYNILQKLQINWEPGRTMVFLNFKQLLHKRWHLSWYAIVKAGC